MDETTAPDAAEELPPPPPPSWAGPKPDATVAQQPAVADAVDLPTPLAPQARTAAERGWPLPTDATANDMPAHLLALSDGIAADVAALAQMDGSLAGAITANAQAARDDLNAATDALARAISDERGERVAGDTALGQRIDAEVGNRNTAIAAEAKARADADTAEATARASADAALRADLNSTDDALMGVMQQLDADRDTIGNLLPENWATGTDSDGGATGFAGTNCTAASSTAQAWQGSRAVRLTVGTASAWAAYLIGSTSVTKAIAAKPGATYTAVAWLRAVSPDTITAVNLRVRWWNASGAQVGEQSQTVTLTSGAWTRVTVTGATPAGATNVASLLGGTGHAGAVIDADGLGLWEGNGGLWAPPGRPVPALGAQAVGIQLATASTHLDRGLALTRLTPPSGQALTATPPPAAQCAGVILSVINAGDGSVTVAGIANCVLAGPGQVRIYSDGTAWRVASGEYWVETAGRRKFEWDHRNLRFQMVWGRTGWREILTFDAAGAVTRGAFHPATNWQPRSGQAGFVRVARVDERLLVWVANVAAKTAATASSPICDLPVGFQFPATNEVQAPAMARNAAGAVNKPILLSSGYNPAVLSAGLPGEVGDHLTAQQITMSAADTWATALPGIAWGTIPTALDAGKDG